LTDFRQFVELYVSNFNDRIPRKKLAEFLVKLVNPAIVKGKGKKIKRAIESIVLLGSYLIEPYERAGNHISAAEGWTVVAATLLHIAEREKLPATHYSPSLSLVWKALDNNLDNLKKEVLERNHFVETNFIFAETDFIRGVRTLITFGWVIAKLMSPKVEVEDRADSEKILDIIKKNLSTIRLCGEADWPSIVCLSLFLEKKVCSTVAEGLLESWVRSIIEANKGKDAPGLPPPYWLQEKVLASLYNQLPPYKAERFSEHSYTMQPALDMLVRRLCRHFVSTYWSQASRLTFCNYIPDEPADWFLWRSERGDLQMTISQQPASWSQWSKLVSLVRGESVPSVLIKHPEWILPFVLTYPHRMNRALSAIIDALIGGRASIF
jgi:hypothetical protein